MIRGKLENVNVYLALGATDMFVVGRKNWLSSGTPKGVETSADLYSLIETAKINKLETYQYRRDLFAMLPFAEIQEEYEALLPRRLTPEEVALSDAARGG